MAKVTILDVIDAGFRAEQFGTVPDWSVPGTGYVARVIADAEIFVSDRVGASAYAAATGAQLLRLKRAELCWVKAELWRRRAAFLDSNAQSALEGGHGVYLERREMLAHAEQADDCVLNNLDLFQSGGESTALGSGASVGYVETGPFRRSACQ